MLRGARRYLWLALSRSHRRDGGDDRRTGTCDVGCGVVKMREQYCAYRITRFSGTGTQSSFFHRNVNTDSHTKRASLLELEATRGRADDRITVIPTVSYKRFRPRLRVSDGGGGSRIRNRDGNGNRNQTGPRRKRSGAPCRHARRCTRHPHFRKASVLDLSLAPAAKLFRLLLPSS